MLGILVFLVGCDAASSPSPTGSQDPYAGLPSNACGGFHLKIVNLRDAPVRVEINGSWSAVVAGSTTFTINEGLSTPRPPQLPWQVVLSDEGTGSQLLSAAMPGPVDQKVVLGSGAPIQTPFDLAEGC
ncbi:MAG: hypothetical protein HY263_04960 [Chloroflexi bacterium]|nr:hypothetical protein [Chloroflexota bacterium]